MTTLTTYIIGFLLSLLCTGAAFGLAFMHERTGHSTPSHELALALLLVLAVGQLLVQVLYFLHLSEESRPRWRLASLVGALLTVFIIVGGTWWIMDNLSHGQAPHPATDGAVTPQTLHD
jgi:cytochrome o ubiquinol oxidase subunit IV